MSCVLVRKILIPAKLPEGVLHPRRIQSGVVAGVQDYGNKIGIPTVNGAILYDEGYTANPLVFCGCVGIAPKGKHRKLRRLEIVSSCSAGAQDVMACAARPSPP